LYEIWHVLPRFYIKRLFQELTRSYKILQDLYRISQEHDKMLNLGFPGYGNAALSTDWGGNLALIITYVKS
jgi:hypothetical protein